MGVVYKALDQVEGRIVALKTLHGAEPGREPDQDATDLRRFDREIRALSLLNHKGIVRLYDVGRFGSRTYFTMEFLRGISLQAFLERGLPGEEEIRWILRVGLKALEALDHLHRAGFVHRDIKPSNIMVLGRSPGGPGEGDAAPAAGGGAREPLTPEAVLADPDPEIKLLDFGLVKPRGAELSPGSAAPGTPLFMAPEQMDPSSAPDPRWDLYSLGVVLHALISRRLPHETVASALSGRPPIPPADRNPACPPALSEAILRLLDPQPHRRWSSASETHRALLAFAGGPPAPAEASPPRLLAPSFVGRTEVLQALRGLLGTLPEGRGRLVFVSGMRGAGKSWLLDKSGIKAQAVLEHGISYFQGRYASGGALRKGLREVASGMLLDLARDPGPASLAAEIGPWGGALLDILGIGSIPGIRSLWPGADGAAPGDLAPERALQAGVALFRASAGRPRLVLLDDLHLADDLDIEILARATRGIGSIPLVLVATYLPEAREASPALGRWIREAAAEGGTAAPLEFHLGAFNDGEASQMVRSMLSPLREVDPSLVNELLDETGGVPRSLESSLSTLWGRGGLRIQDGSWRRAPDPPSSPGGDPAREPDPLSGLEPEDLAVLLPASVLGEHFEPELLLALVPGAPEGSGAGGDRGGRRGSEERVTARLHVLAARGLLAERSTGFAFLRPGLREKLEELLDPERRRALHARAAQALLDLAGEASADQWEEIAVHFGGGGEPEKALEFHLKAARRAARLYANRRGISAFRAARSLAGPGDRASISAELGRLHARIGEYGAALACFQEALAVAGDSTVLLDEVGRVHQRQGDFSRALECFERSLALAGEDRRALSRVQNLLGGVHFDRGDLARAAEHFRSSLETCGASGDLPAMLAAHSGLGLVEKRRNALEPAAAHFCEAIACAERAGDETQAATALNNLGNTCRLQGKDPEAIDCFRRSIAIRERIGDRPGLAICLNNLARLLARRGELASAIDASAESLRIFREVGDRKGVLIASGNGGAFRLLGGDFPAAREAFLAARALAERLSDRRGLADACQSLGILEVSRGEPAEADRHFREGLRLLAEEEDRDLRASILSRMASSRLALGDAEGAGDAVEEGLWLLGEAGSEESRGALLLAASELHRSRGELEASLERAQKALALLEPAGARFDIALAHRQAGRVYRDMGPDLVDRAEDHLRTGLRMFEEMGARFEAALTEVDIGELWEALGESGEASRHYLRAEEVLAAADAPRPLASLRERLARLAEVRR